MSSRVELSGLLVVGGEVLWGEVGRASMFTVRVNLLVARRNALEEAPIMLSSPCIFKRNIVVRVTASNNGSGDIVVKGA